MWPFDSLSSSRRSQRGQSTGWDRYRLLPTSESGTSESGSISNLRQSLDTGYQKEWPSSAHYSQSCFKTSPHLKHEEEQDSQNEDDTFLPFSPTSYSSRANNRSNSLLSFTLNRIHQFRRYPWYIKLIILGLFCLICFHLILGTILGHKDGIDSGDIFSNPTQALELLKSLTSISSPSTNANDPTRIIFKDHSPGLSSTRIVPIKQYESVSDQCLESWISKGEWDLNRGCSNHLTNEIESVHAVVNGSDLVQISARHLFRPDGPLKMDSSHRYGDHNELLYSMRSFRDSLKKGDEIWRNNGRSNNHHGGFGLKKMNILASAYPLDYQIEYIQSGLKSLVGGGADLADEGVDAEVPEQDLESSNHQAQSQQHHPGGSAGSLLFGAGSLGKDRILSGQIPRWLLKSTAEGRGIEVEVHHDSNYFAPLPTSADHAQGIEEVQEWREKVIPTFNSLAVESQIYNLPTTSSAPDSIVYLNDDFFTLLPTSVSDYSSPLYGTVIKSLPRITSMYWPSEDPLWRLWNPAGEEVGIKRAAWQLGQRFPMRALPYVTHHPRSLSLPLLREAAQTFPEAFSDTALSRFRAQQDVPVSIQAVFLGSWYIVQRHREALLWSWAVAKWGGSDGMIDQRKRDGMWNELTRFDGGSHKSINPKNSFKVLKPTRSSLSESSKDSLLSAGMQPSLRTDYDFSSQDGYALSYLDHLWFWQRKSKNGLPDLSPSAASSKTSLCTIKRQKCLGLLGKSESASDFFKRISFRDQECGDCFIPALISASGTKGVEAFLPSQESRIPDEAEFERVEEELRSKNKRDGDLWELEVEHLPITKDWKTTNFSLDAVVKPKIQPSSSEVFQNPRKNPNSSSPAGHAKTKDSRRIQRSRSLRMWTMRLIQRYSYVLGTAESELYQMKWTDKVENRLKDLDSDQGKFSKVEYWSDQESVDDHAGSGNKPLTYLALNDDLKEDDKTKKLNDIVGKWFDGRWPATESKMPDERPTEEL